MQEVTVSDVWRGWFDCLEFVTPDGGSGDGPGSQVGTHAR
jgi:hypothetical protein